MKTYPIRVPRVSYRGADRRKQAKTAETNRIAAELERHINALIEKQAYPICSYDYYEISSATGYDLETVRRLCFGIDGGHNGFTVIRPGLTMEQALEENSKGRQP